MNNKTTLWFGAGLGLLAVWLMYGLTSTVARQEAVRKHYLLAHHCKVISTYQVAEEHWVGKYSRTYSVTERDYRCDNGELDGVQG